MLGSNNCSLDPARIDRRVRLPQSTVNITRVGAGRRHEPVRAIAGEHVELFCPSSGAEQPRTRWFKRGDGGSLNPVNPIPKCISTSMRTIQGITTAVLSFRGLRRNDFGEYICIAHNRAGRDEARVLLRGNHITLNLNVFLHIFSQFDHHLFIILSFCHVMTCRGWGLGHTRVVTGKM